MHNNYIRLRLDSEFKAEVFEIARSRKCSVSQLVRNLLLNEVEKKSQLADN